MDQVRGISRTWTAGGVIVRVTVMAAVWLVLSGGDLRYWGIALLAVLGAAFASLLLVPSSGLGWSPAGWLRFIPFFLRESVLGGTDVALRALSIRPRVDPGYVDFEFRLAEEPARVLVANTMSLMPGTLSVSLDGAHLQMHVLDRSIPAAERARQVEEYMARMFRLKLADEPLAPELTGD